MVVGRPVAFFQSADRHHAEFSSLDTMSSDDGDPIAIFIRFTSAVCWNLLPTDHVDEATSSRHTSHGAGCLGHVEERTQPVEITIS